MIDNRGREVPLCRRSSLRAGIPSPARKALARADLTSGRHILSVLAAAVSIAVVGIPLILLFAPLSWRSWWTGVFIAAFALPLFIALHYRLRIGQPGLEENAREAMLVAGLCPSCAFELRAGIVEADGCTVCAECGAAWRLPMNP